MGIKYLLIHTTTWMNFTNMMLSEGSQTQKVLYYMIPFIGNIQNRSIHRDRWRLVAAGGCGERGREWEWGENA